MYLCYHTAALFLGILLDAVIGDPKGWYHPVMAIGWLIQRLEQVLRRLFPSTKRGERLAGIVLDTKNFVMRAGSRTFEAAAFLRRAGADTADVQRLFQGDLEGMVSKYDVIRQAELYRPDVALAVVGQDGVDRVAAAQAADELLTLKGVKASFVVYRSGSAIQMSARSLGEINVQVILEALGGGGNSATAGGRIENGDILDVRERLTQAIDAYFEK